MNRSDFLKALGLGLLAPKIVAPKPEMVTTIGSPIELSGKAAVAMKETDTGGLTGLLQATSGSSLDGITGGLHDFPVIPMNWRAYGTITGITED